MERLWQLGKHGTPALKYAAYNKDAYLLLPS